MTPIRREAASTSSSESGMPQRRAIAIRWMMALVEPPSAICTVSAFSKEPRESTSRGRRAAHTIATISRPESRAMRGWPASAAGIEEAPGKVMPSVSASAVRVAAVPIVMQWP